ncbi:glycoside hydrolase family 99-like domain-containing protein [Cereibacter sphaeroides]|nr:glycoside hydrolase family 99-like domain-containing protein [Cereibacter sphaeroides]
MIEAASPRTPVEVEIYLYDQAVLRAVCDINRNDIGALVGMPVTAGFSAPLRDVAPKAVEAVLTRLKADGPGEVRIADILRIEVLGTSMSLPISAHVGSITREALYKALAPRPSKFPGGKGGRQRLLDGLLAPEMSHEPPAVGVIAYYTTVFAPDGERGGLRGSGAADWADVAAAQPLFPEHGQPNLPADLGFYDLRIDQVQSDQVALARRYGVSGFCYEIHRVEDQILGVLPVDRHVAMDLDLDFCLSWVVEGGPDGLAQEQRRGHADDTDFIHALIPYFRAKRYLTIDGAPLLQVEGLEKLRHPAATVERWRQILQDEGFPGLHLCLVEGPDAPNPQAFGCDSSCQDPRRDTRCPTINARIPDLASGFTGAIRDYADLLRQELSETPAAHLRFRTALPGWDQTCQRGLQGNLYTGASPAGFETWMSHLVGEARGHLPEGARLVFVRSWNDWPQGAYLEPDRRHGHEALQAIRAAVSPRNLALAPLRPVAEGAADPLAETRRYVASLIRANAVLSDLIAQGPVGLHAYEASGFVPIPDVMLRIERLTGQKFEIETVNGRRPPADAALPVPLWQGVTLSGWFLINDVARGEAMIALRNLDMGGERYLASVPARQARDDVVVSLGLGPRAQGCGFHLRGRLQGVPPGRYEVEILIPGEVGPRRALAINTDLTLILG